MRRLVAFGAALVIVGCSGGETPGTGATETEAETTETTALSEPTDPATTTPPPPATSQAPPPSSSTPSQNCDPSYPTVCIPPTPPDLDCGDVTFRRFTVVAPDPHGFDGNHDGIGCESD